MIEVNCETDFVARNDEFRQLAKDLALQVVAARPLCVRREEVPADSLAEQKQVFLAQAADKPENIREKIADGKLNAWYSEVVLMDQKYVKDDSKTIREMIQEVNARTGENITVSRFARFVVGESSPTAMPIRGILQAYIGGGEIRGRYGDGSEIRVGANYYPMKTRGIRVNAEWLRLNNSPVGYTAVPWPRQYLAGKAQLERNLERERQLAAGAQGLSPQQIAARLLEG